MARGTTATAPAVEEATEEVAVESQETEAPATNETDTQKRNRLRNKAERIILERHRAEFNEVAEEIFSEEGLKYNRRLTDEERAEEKLNKLLAENPKLAEKLAAQAAQG